MPLGEAFEPSPEAIFPFREAKMPLAERRNPLKEEKYQSMEEKKPPREGFKPPVADIFLKGRLVSLRQKQLFLRAHSARSPDSASPRRPSAGVARNPKGITSIGVAKLANRVRRATPGV